MTQSGGARLLEKISDSKNEKKSKNYYLSKLYKAAEGEVDPSFLIIQDTCSETLTAFDMKYIHLDRRTIRLNPIKLNCRFNLITLFQVYLPTLVRNSNRWQFRYWRRSSSKNSKWLLLNTMKIKHAIQ
jgi:hypothetical protein